MKDHLFISSFDGCLYDTRQSGWAHLPPLRKEYWGHFGRGQRALSVSQVKAALRAGKYTSIGAYPLYFITKEGDALSFEGAKQDFANIVSGFTIVTSIAINYEDADCFCCVTNARIPAAYADEPTSEEG